MKTWTQFEVLPGRSFLSDLQGEWRRSVGSGGWSHFGTSAVSLFIARPFGWLSLFTSQPFSRSCRGCTGPLAGGSLGHLPSRQGSTPATCGPVTKMSNVFNTPPGLPHVLYGLVCEVSFFPAWA